jgi:hypothetical protein
MDYQVIGLRRFRASLKQFLHSFDCQKHSLPLLLSLWGGRLLKRTLLAIRWFFHKSLPPFSVRVYLRHEYFALCGFVAAFRADTVLPLFQHFTSPF